MRKLNGDRDEKMYHDFYIYSFSFLSDDFQDGSGASRSDSGLIVALGDSVSYGYGLDGNKNDKGLYVNKLAEKLESDIQNYSIVGADSNVLRSFTERAVAGKDMSNLKLNRVISDASLITVSIGGK